MESKKKITKSEDVPEFFESINSLPEETKLKVDSQLEAIHLEGKYKELKERYDQFLINEGGLLSKTEAVFQTGYSSGHDKGYERALIEATGPRWVKASERLPVHFIAKFVRIEGVMSIAAWHKYHERFVDDAGDFHPADQVEWLDESTPAEPLTEDARYELRLALRDMIKLVKRIYGDNAIPAEHQKRIDAANGLLIKHSKVTDVLRTPAGREEDAVAFHDQGTTNAHHHRTLRHIQKGGQMTQITDNIFAVEVPEGVDGFDFNIVNDHYELTYYTMEDNEEKELHGIQIPPGSWRVLCTTRYCTPEQAKEITGEEVYPSIALAGMCKAKGLDGDKNYCLIKNIS